MNIRKNNTPVLILALSFIFVLSASRASAAPDSTQSVRASEGLDGKNIKQSEGKKISMTTAMEDANLWLEDVEGKKALDWVRDRNAVSVKALETSTCFRAYSGKAIENS